MKNIIMTPETIEEACAKLRAQLAGTHVLKDKIDISVPTKVSITDALKPTVLVSVIADRKMRELVRQCDKEIGWHGTVSYDEEANTYLVEDIFVFPQEVTGATVQSIDEVYGLWLMEFDDDTFNKLRLHGHSHVNMGAFPSGVDTAYQETLTDRVQDFYIFIILNKRNDYYLCLFDIANNLMYEKEDIHFDAEIDAVEAWVTDTIAKNVKEKKYAVTNTVTSQIRFPVVLKTWRVGWAWNADAGGYVPTTQGALQDYLTEQDEAAQSSKRKPGRPKNAEKKSAYEEYRQEKVKGITAQKEANKVGNMYRSGYNCNGICVACNNPCEYYGSY